MGDHAQGNYVLYTNRNTILNAPFVFGARLYLYDIEKDKKLFDKESEAAIPGLGLGDVLCGK